MRNNQFNPSYIKCPYCNNILDLSFINKTCPNPLCSFDFTGLNAFIDKDDEILRSELLSAFRTKNETNYKLITVAIRYNIGNYLAHFIECNWGAHYNTLFKEFIYHYLNDLNILKAVLKSNIIKEGGNCVISKNGYKMFYELYTRLKKIHNTEISSFLISEFPELHRQHYKESYQRRILTIKNRHFSQDSRLF